MAMGAAAGIRQLLADPELPEELRFDWESLTAGQIGEILRWLWKDTEAERLGDLVRLTYGALSNLPAD